MTKASKKLLTVFLALCTMICMLVGVALLPKSTTMATATTTITFDGDFYTTDTPAYAAVGGKTEMGGGITSAYLPSAGYDWDWVTGLTTPSGVDGKCIGTTIPSAWCFAAYQPIIFDTPIDVTEDMNSMTFRIYADLSTADTYGILTYGDKPIANSTAGIWIYALDETGLAGEGVMIPFNFTQRAWVDFVISGEDFEKFIDANGQVTGFKMASGIVNGGNETVFYEGNRAALYIDTLTFGTVDTGELKASDYNADGKATLFTGNGDYDYAYGDWSRYDYAATVNGATVSNYSDWGCGEVYLNYDNINSLSVENAGAKYSFADMKASSNDGYALAAEISGFGLTRYRSIMFDKKVKATDIVSLTFRMFTNLDSTEDDTEGYCGYSTYYGCGANEPGGVEHPYSGIFFYSPDSDCAWRTGVMLDPFVAQREWTEVTIKGDDLMKLADKDGYISGIRLGSAFMSGSDSQLFGSWSNSGINQDNYDLTACVIIDEITVTAPVAVEKNVELFSGNNADEIADTAELKVEGFTASDLNAVWGIGAVTDYKTFVDLYNLTASEEGALYDLDEVKAGSGNGHALGINFGYWGYTVSPTVYFNKVVDVADVKAVTFRIYANISAVEPYGKYNAETGKFVAQDSMRDTMGIFIYSVDKNAKGTGVLVKADVKQREWVDLTISGADLLKLADANGRISGFKIGAGLVINQANPDDYDYMYPANSAYDKGNALFIDSITAQEHVYGAWIAQVAATCTANGTLAHYHCSDCGKDFDANYDELDSLTIAATGHSSAAAVEENRVEPTCTESGSYDSVVYCSACGIELSRESQVISANGHTFGAWIAQVSATASANGVKAHKDCMVCGKHFDAEGVEIADLTIPVAINKSVMLFDGNNASSVADTAEIKVEGFTAADLNAVWAIGAAMDYKTFVDLYNLEASEGEGVLYDLDEVKAGSTNGHALGINLGGWGYTVSQTINFSKEVNVNDIEALSFRIYANISAVEPYGKYNSETGKFLGQDTSHDTMGIFLYSVDKNAKGTGVLVKADVKQREWVDLIISGEDLLKLADANGRITGFKIGAGLVINTAYEGDYDYMYLANEAYDKGNALFIDSVTAFEHDYGAWIAEVPATCTETGTLGHYHCSDCGKNFDLNYDELNSLTIPANGHTSAAAVEENRVEPTCTQNGSYDSVVYCSVCGDELSRETHNIDAKGHTFGTWIDEVPATCESTGTLGHYHCSDCGKDFDTNHDELDSLTIAATGHTYGSWIAEVPATIGVAGTLGHYHCSACGKDFDTNYVELNSLVIPALDGIKWVSLSLNGDIGVNFYVCVGGAESLTANSGALTGVKVTVEDVNCFKFTINVAAKDYKNDIAISIDGTEFSETYKVVTYIDAIKNDSPAYALVQSLKTYCEAARVFFAEETAVATDDVEMAAATAGTVEGSDDDVTLVGATLILETKTAIKVYFKAESLGEKTFTVGGVAVTPEAVDGYDNLYMITIDDIAAQDLEVKYTIVVGGYTITYSALSYAYAVVNDGESGVAIANLAKALYNYNVQANAYAAL